MQCLRIPLHRAGLRIGFELTTYSVEEGLEVEVCVIVINSTLSREAIVTISSSDVEAEGELVIAQSVTKTRCCA